MIDALQLEKHLGAVHDGNFEATFLKLVRQFLTVQKAQRLLVLEDRPGPVSLKAPVRRPHHVGDEEMRVQLGIEVTRGRMIEDGSDQLAVPDTLGGAAKGVVLLQLPDHGPDRRGVSLLDPRHAGHVGYGYRLGIGQGAVVTGPVGLHLRARLLVLGELRGDEQLTGRRMPPGAQGPELLFPHRTGKPERLGPLSVPPGVEPLVGTLHIVVFPGEVPSGLPGLHPRR